MFNAQLRDIQTIRTGSLLSTLKIGRFSVNKEKTAIKYFCIPFSRVLLVNIQYGFLSRFEMDAI
jgi:hypothetical protein